MIHVIENEFKYRSVELFIEILKCPELPELPKRETEGFKTLSICVDPPTLIKSRSVIKTPKERENTWDLQFTTPPMNTREPTRNQPPQPPQNTQLPNKVME